MTVDVDRNLLTPCSQLQLVGFVSFRPDEPLKYAEGFIEMYSTTTTTLALYLHDHKTLQYYKSIR